MRKLLVTLDDSLDDWLKGQANQNETVRQALMLYKEDISTPDTISGLRRSYAKLTAFLETKTEYYDTVFIKLEKLIKELEMRM